ncbi:hypothetical protein DL93DRAFT_2165730 [Clavulina sp. PMI_390]|nr:hypothetical protein DL93DRAFT_2165730 [Clavulina sp. PMI_390]
MMSEPTNPVHPSLVFPDADIVLRSNDLMTFHVNKAVLREASQYFRSMFSIAPPNSGEIQVLDIDVPGRTLLILLLSESLYNFPMSEPNPTVDDVLALMRAAEKLEFDAAEEQLKNGPLVTALAAEPNPLRAWAIAKAHQLPEAADAAMCRYFLSPDDFKARWHTMPELTKVNAMEFSALIHRRERAIAALRADAGNALWNRDCLECEQYKEIESNLDPEQLETLEPHVEGRSVLKSLLENQHPQALGIEWILVAFSLVESKTTCGECKASSQRTRTFWETRTTAVWRDNLERGLKQGLKPNTTSWHWRGV